MYCILMLTIIANLKRHSQKQASNKMNIEDDSFEVYFLGCCDKI